MVKLSPVEQLRQLLERHGADSDDVIMFFQQHKEQACATCLVLACSQQIVQQTVSHASSTLNYRFSLIIVNF